MTRRRRTQHFFPAAIAYFGADAQLQQVPQGVLIDIRYHELAGLLAELPSQQMSKITGADQKKRFHTILLIQP